MNDNAFEKVRKILRGEIEKNLEQGLECEEVVEDCGMRICGNPSLADKFCPYFSTKNFRTMKKASSSDILFWDDYIEIKLQTNYCNYKPKSG